MISKKLLQFAKRSFHLKELLCQEGNHGKNVWTLRIGFEISNKEFPLKDEPGYVN